MKETLVIYLDVLLFVNAVVNFTILYLTYKILGIKISKPRIAFATTLTSFYGLVVVLPQMSALLNIFFKAAVAFLTVYIAFDFRNLRLYLKSIAVFLAVTFGYIGVITSFQYMPFASSAFFIQNGEVYYNLPLPYLLVSTVALFLIVNVISRHFSKKLKKGQIVACRALLFEKEILFSAFCDSGNFLVEPLSGLPAVILNTSLVFPEEKEKSESKLFSMLEADEKYKNRLRIIPFHGAGQSSGILVGLRPDRFYCEGEEREVILALDSNFFKESKGYDAILNL